MPFGQQSGPPASGRQVKELLGLLQGIGHSGFRDARGPMGFTQRQAGGRFTSDEAAGFIDQLQESESDGGSVSPPPRPSTGAAAGAVRGEQGVPPGEPGPIGEGGEESSRFERALARAPAATLAAELRRRGWTVDGPRAAGTDA